MMNSLPRTPGSPLRTLGAPLAVRVLTLGFAAVFAGVIGASGFAAGSAPQIGRPAPDFTATDTKGNSLSLTQFRGQTLVLERTNADCPFHRKHYISTHMPSVKSLHPKN